ncbi:hypothetical protein CCR78_00975 [Rhodovulum imhoffii]|nr:GGDEF domain-containing protein [Rhodovulum imhoffii]MBK5932568.1 hypothetical protein [Rhodovulum imhoffii]
MPVRALNSLMPMHLWFSPLGEVLTAGPTLAKLAGKAAFSGMPFQEVLEVHRPFPVSDMAGLTTLEGERLGLRLYALPEHNLKGSVVVLPDGGAFLNLSLGLSVIEVVGRYRLTLRDFAPSELAVEMLYLVEAKTAVLEEYKRLNTRLKRAREQAEERAATDMLTGLRNRRALQTALNAAVNGAQPFGLMHVDLDYFKQVNDRLGHAAGDEVLQVVARILLDETRRSDTVARAGGDEFIILFLGLVDARQLLRIGRRIIAQLEEPIPFGEDTCRVSASIGMTLSTFYTHPDPRQMLKDADDALYEAKRAGRGQVRVVRI